MKPGRVPIHVRRVVGAGGEVTSENEVQCLMRGATVSVAECEACRDYAGSELDLEHHRNWVLCRRLTPNAVRSVEPTRHAVLRRRYPTEPTPGERTTVGEVMTRDVWCVRDDVGLDVVARVLRERRLGGLPVVDAAGRCIGVVSLPDLARAEGQKTVRELMSRLTFVLPDNASVSQAAALMALEGVHRLPIVTDDGKVAGIVTSLDLLGWLARQDGYVLPK